MWRAIFIAAILISSFSRSTGLKCRSGFDLEGTKCRQLRDSILDCQEVQTVSNDGNQCSIRNMYCSSSALTGEIPIERLAIFRCPEGFILNNSRRVCEKKVLHGNPEVVCEEPYHERNGRCLVVDSIIQVCQPNSTLPEGCLSRIYTTSEKKCFKGYQLNGDECNFTKGSSEIICNGSKTYDSTFNECLGEESFSKKHRCNQGVIENKQCIETLTSPIEYLCPPQSADSSENPLTLRLSCLEGRWDRGSCKNTRNVQPVRTCPALFTLVSADETKCELIEPAS